MEKNQGTDLSFSVRVDYRSTNVTSIALVATFADGRNQWKTFAVGIAIEQRPDFEFGSLTAGSDSLTKTLVHL